MDKRTEKSLRSVSVLFFILWTGLVSTAAFVYVRFTGEAFPFSKPVLTASILWGAGIIVGGAYSRIITRRTERYVEAIHTLFDRAMSGEGRLTGYRESGLSALEHKMARYIGILRTREQKVQQEKENIQSFISDISHQTKTPLSNIILYSQLLLEEQELGKRQRELAEEIGEQSGKLDWLIQSLIKMSRMETGLITPVPVRIPAMQPIGAAVAQMEPKAEEKGIRVEVSCDGSIQACCDPRWTGEALFNILDNAVKYTPPGGFIAVSAVSYELFARIDISDTGVGMEEQELPRIFHRFYRCRNASATEGIGIGLYLAREIVSAQGGYIKVASKPGEGSVFSVFLPREPRGLRAGENVS